MELTNRYAEALELAYELHKHQYRKGTEIPYLSHLLAVSALVMEHGGGEDEAIAALLHDAVEDAGKVLQSEAGVRVLEHIRQRFGEAVAQIVRECSDTETEPKPPYLERKQAYLRHLTEASPPARLVSAADKLHNLRAIVADYRTHGEALWQRFVSEAETIEEKRRLTLWYYRELAKEFSSDGGSRLIGAELERLLSGFDGM
ncbi:HD domain-containing protein [Meiothermus ruber]|uniref:Metal dependent phosphohydrolase n=1 Tax=Meiothermus ruber (strain ATCC 35948 / DSM 1279 / VKM B-1258 / 21) TaxID=504728 RepID=D3PL37_MEIRD|nr:HD domain-containing protein [Meiothermus ruber]ADD26933.1 metal dependent phosphohydrolase [Meiothermus ruber DSM 1279]AGK03387.1 metal dependent phosphohydrolase [Meiothermus ruber DSM 1279]